MSKVLQTLHDRIADPSYPQRLGPTWPESLIRNPNVFWLYDYLWLAHTQSTELAAFPDSQDQTEKPK